MKYKVGDKVLFIQPLMGMTRDDGIIVREVFAKDDEREIVDMDEEYYIVKNQGEKIRVKHKDLDSVTEIVEAGKDENISHGNTIRPGYYQSSMGDVFDIANAYKLDMPLGMAAKYILRAGKKDKSKEIEDLEKAIRCIERAIELRRDQH